MLGDLLAGLAVIAGGLLILTGATGSYSKILTQLGISLPGMGASDVAGTVSSAAGGIAGGAIAGATGGVVGLSSPASASSGGTVRGV